VVLDRFDYKKLLYAPIKGSSLNSVYRLIFPHEFSDDPYPTRELFESKRAEIIVLAEISYDSSGQRTELDWANELNIPVIAFHKEDQKNNISSNEDFVYYNSNDLLERLEPVLKENYRI